MTCPFFIPSDIANMEHILHTEPLQESRPHSSFQRVEDPEEIEESYSGYLQDESRFKGRADRIAFPEIEADVLHLVRSAVSSAQPITVSSARTGITGAGVPVGGTLVSMERMDHILEIRKDERSENRCMRCQPGLSLERLERILTGKDSPNGPPELFESDFWADAPEWFYPPDPTEKTAHLGGTAATNASGSRSFHYGPTRNFIRGLRIVLSNAGVLALNRGDVWLHAGDSVRIQGPDGVIEWTVPDFRMPPVKHAAGYHLASPMDLIDVFIGSEGTLGILTEVDILLQRRPECVFGLLSFFRSDDAALRFVRSIKTTTVGRIAPAALEYFDPNALQLLRDAPSERVRSFPTDTAAAIYSEQHCARVEADGCMEAYGDFITRWDSEILDTWAATDSRELEVLTAFRHAVPETVNAQIGRLQRDIPELRKIGTDFAVPDEAFSEMMRVSRQRLEQSGIQHIGFGHIGDNHVHINLVPSDPEELDRAKSLYEDLAREAVRLGGTVSAEHGIGKLKKSILRLLYAGPEMQKLANVKAAFDPKGLFGPGNMI